MKKLKSLLLFFVCGLVACAMAIPLAACNDGTGGGGGGDGSSEDNRVLQSITVDSFDAKVNFAVGEEFSYEGLTVTANYLVLGESITTATEDVTSKVDFDTSEFDSSKAGTYTVYLSYTYRKVTMYGDYNVNVLSDLEGTIAGLEVTYDGARQIDLTAENPTATIDLTKIKVTRMSGDTVDDVGETILPEGNYTLSYSKDGGALTAVEAGATSLSGLTKGVYSIYALSTYTLGNETFEMSGFVTVFVVDSLASIAKDEGGTLTYDYGADVNTIGSDWTFTATYGSGATVKLNAEDVDFGERVNDSEGENSVTVSYTEEVLKYDAEADDAVTDSVTVDCDVTYTIGENPNAGQEVTDTYSVNFSDASKGWALGEGTIQDTVIGADGTKDAAGGIISLLSTKSDGSAQAKTKEKSAKAADGTQFTNAIQIGTISSTKAWAIDVSSYDESAEVVISVYASTSGSERTIALYQEASSSATALFTSESFTDSGVAYLSEWTVSGGGVYYVGSTKDAINFFAISVDVTYTSGGSDTPAQSQTFIADFADTSKGWSGVKNEKIPGTVYVASDGTVGTEKTDGVLSLISNDNAKYSSRNTAKSEDGSISFSTSVQMGTIGSSKAWCVDLSDYGADTNVKISVYAATSSGDNVARKIGLYSSTSSSSLIEESRALDNADIAYCVEWSVTGGNVFYIGSTKDAINYFKIVIEIGV